MQQQIASGARSSWFCSALVLALPEILEIGSASAEQPPSPCHPNPNAAADRSTVATRGDVINLPGPLKDRLIQLADRPHNYLPLQVFAEADGASQLFQYHPLDTTGFEPNIFNTIFPGGKRPRAADRHRGQLRLANGRRRAPGAGAQARATDRSNNPRAFNDVFTDISPWTIHASSCRQRSSTVSL
jgi:hypothetical protein